MYILENMNIHSSLPIFKHKKYILMILCLVYIYIYIFFLYQCSIKSFLILSDSYKMFYYLTILLLI